MFLFDQTCQLPAGLVRRANCYRLPPHTNTNTYTNTTHARMHPHTCAHPPSFEPLARIALHCFSCCIAAGIVVKISFRPDRDKVIATGYVREEDVHPDARVLPPVEVDNSPVVAAAARGDAVDDKATAQAQAQAPRKVSFGADGDGDDSGAGAARDGQKDGSRDAQKRAKKGVNFAGSQDDDVVGVGGVQAWTEPDGGEEAWVEDPRGFGARGSRGSVKGE
jgi:hypothetical protein